MFTCVCCQGHKFLHSVVELSQVAGLRTGEARARFLDLDLLARQPVLFLQLDRNWCCRTCQKALDSSQMPALAARNGLAATWGSLPQQLRDLNQTEQEIVALTRVRNINFLAPLKL